MKLSAVQLDVLAAAGRSRVWRNDADWKCFSGAHGRAVTQTVRSLWRLDLIEPVAGDDSDPQTYFALTESGRAVLEGGTR